MFVLGFIAGLLFGILGAIPQIFIKDEEKKKKYARGCLSAVILNAFIIYVFFR